MRTDSTLGVIFFTRKKRNNPEKLDIYVRITVNKKRAEFSIKRDIAVCNWNIFRCRAKETDQNLILLNTYLDDVYAEVLNAHKQLHSERKLITAKAIKSRYLREDEDYMTLMKAFQYHNSNINRVRLKNAANLLSNPALHISDIAFSTGFNDANYFSKVFKNQYQMSP